MSVFQAGGFDWQVSLDAFVIADVKKETSIDLADISAGGWLAVETDASAVGRILAVVCADQIRQQKMTGRQFAKLIRGEVIEAGRKALLDEGADFFPASEWSAIRANLKARTTSREQATAIQAAMGALEGMPEGMRQGAVLAMMEAVREGINSASGESIGSASGPAAIQLPPATNEPENAELPPED